MASFDLISLINNPERVSDRLNKLIICCFAREELFLFNANIIKETNTFVSIIFNKELWTDAYRLISVKDADSKCDLFAGS